MAANNNPQAERARTRPDLVAGAVFIAIASAFGWGATRYEMGQLVAMGPGFVPLSLSIMLGILGIALAAFGRSESADAPGSAPWRGGALVCISLVLFGAYSRDLGLLPIVFLCGFLTALASPQNSVVSALSIAAALSLLCWLVFKVGLGLSLPLIGPVFGSYQIY
ncbi:tripartite tricarboxylate transporter TctB family protein [Sinorhizobium fredii]|uniref:tripartite tricarboxylate transporter TctB family protein n=1 Tax=Rhizobium fredii TaxID=380 RepID=UPI0005955E70|nr:tripartite tricarboxylate transporter TctB family protein [Sinorhizobium fredii]WOS66186.1 tripartite tricarboxylate transporter TctB family protein [Sinorhizobium fredii GR64]